MTPEILTIATVIGLVVLAVLLVGVARAIPVRIDQPPPLAHPAPTSSDIERLLPRIVELEGKSEALTLAISEGIARVDRAEKRIQKTVTSARRLVSQAGLEHAGIEAEYEELQSGDDAPSEAREVLSLLPEMEAPTHTGIPGVDASELARIREAYGV